MLSDISALSYDYRYEYKKRNNREVLKSPDEIYLSILLRHDAVDQERLKSYFFQTEEQYVNGHSGYIIGTISL